MSANLMTALDSSPLLPDADSSSFNPTTPKFFRIGTINTQSSMRASSELLINLIVKNNLDICAIQDTGPVPNKIDFVHNGLEIISFPPPLNDKNGGIALVFKNTLKNAISPSKTQPQCPRIKVFDCLYPSSFSLYVVYNQSSSNSVPNTLKGIHFGDRDILVGDLNSYPDKIMDKFSTLSTKGKNTKFVSDLLDRGWTDTYRVLNPTKKSYSRVGSYTTQEKGTYHTASRIDHILTRRRWINKLHEASIIETDECDSDHRLVTLALRSKNEVSRFVKSHITFRKGTKDKDKWIQFQKNLPTPPPFTFNVNDNNEAFSSNILNTYNETFPEKTIHINNWHREAFTKPEYKSIKKAKKLCYHISSHIKKVVWNGEEPNHELLTQYINNLPPLSIRIPQEYSNDAISAATRMEKLLHKKAKSFLKRERAKHIKQKVDDIIKKIDGDGHNVFKVLRNHEVEHTACIINNNKAETNKEKIHQILNDTWQEIFNPQVEENEEIEDFLKYLPSPNAPPPTPDFSVENIKHIIRNKLPTAPGYSKVSWKMLKNCRQEYYTSLGDRFKYYFAENVHPSNWKKGITSLIPKPNTPPTPDGFRPITLLSVEYKLYTMIIGEALLKWSLEHKVIPDSQNGALPDRGCDACLWSLLPIINESNKNNLPIHLFYIDYSKAFDSVEHWVLRRIFEKLKLGHMGEVIMDLIANSTTQIKINNEIIDSTINIGRGTKQGDGISPLLFNLFMSPLLWKIEKESEGINYNGLKFKVAAIMDDVVYGTQNSKEGERITNIVFNYSKITGININPKKSAYAWKNDTRVYSPTYKGKEFELLGSSKSYRYLGFWLNLDLNWQDLKDHLQNQIRVILNLITSKFYLSPAQMIKLINATIHAVIGYRMQVILFPTEWINNIESMITTALFRSTKVYSFSGPMWTTASNFIPLRYLNHSRLIGSLWRTMQNKNSICRESLLTLLATPPKPIPAVGAPSWIEPQDILNHNCLYWYHHEISNKVPPIALPPYSHPSLPQPSQSERDVTLFTDGSLNSDENGEKMAAGIAHQDLGSIGWPIHGPSSSTEAELQAITGAIHMFPKAHRIVCITDSKASINAVIKARRQHHTNLHKLANRVTLRQLNLYIKNRIVIEVQKPIHIAEPSIQLIHMYSHSDTNRERWKYNREKFKSEARRYVELNDEADTAAKNACTFTNLGPSPFHPVSDPLTIYSPKNPTKDFDLHLRELSKQTEGDRFKAKDWTKANRWLHKAVDLETTKEPVLKGSRATSTLSLKLLNSVLPTKPTIRRTTWFKNLPADDPRKTTYANDNCPWCETRESHKHIFEECPQRIPFRDKIRDQILKLINSRTKKPTATIPWWFSHPKNLPFAGNTSQNTVVPKDFREDIGWRGFIPCALYNFLTQLMPAATADQTGRDIARLYAENNLEIWRNRCEKLHEKPLNPVPTPQSSTPYPTLATQMPTSPQIPPAPPLPAPPPLPSPPLPSPLPPISPPPVTPPITKLQDTSNV